MRRLLRALTPMLGLLATGALASTAIAAEAEAPRVVSWIQVRGTINPAVADYLGASLKRAQEQKAQALVLELDTPGGLVSATQEMAQAISRSEVPVVVFVTPAGASATSAGALLTLASHVAAMTPGAHVGAAHPVDSGGKEIEGKVGEKAENDVSAFARGLAEIRGRDVKIAEEIVRKSVSFTAQEAFDRKLVEILAQDRGELLSKLEGRVIKLKPGTELKLRTQGAEIRELRMSLGQELLHRIAHPNIATLLLSAGALLIYAEIQTAGLGVAGVLGGICLLLAFMSFQMLPIRWGAVALLVLGFVMMLAEIFSSAHGALAVGGVISLILGLLWIVDPAQSSLTVSPAVWIPVTIFLGGGVLLIAWFARRSLADARKAADAVGGRSLAGLSGYSAVIERVNPDGLSGKALVRGELWDFVSYRPRKPGEQASVRGVKGFKVELD